AIIAHPPYHVVKKARRDLAMRLYRAAGVALLISLALAGCVPPAAQKSPAEVAASQQADALAQQGKFDDAAQAYLALA
ncbi:hypothetical protein M1702_25135, partial [Salmonella enterica subsp. enterica serovar Poona]|uniref:hypothetical protein n=1 Tax=Salmonella enterica TaxID=28901 RepID=UPI0021B24DC2